MNLFFFVILLFGLQIICLYVGAKSSKEVKSQEDYYLAGKNIRFFPLMMTFIATQVGGGLVLGAAQEAYQFGWYVLFYPLGASLGLALLAFGIGKKLAEFQVSTVAQIFEEVYASSTLKKIASLLSILSLFMILIGQVIASSKFMVSLGVDNSFFFITFWTIVIVYTALGGLRAVIATDIVQALFFMGAFIFCLAFVFLKKTGVCLETLSFTSSKAFSFTPAKLCTWLAMPLLFMVIEQDMGQRCFAAKTPKIVSKAAFFAALFTFLISLIPIFFGVLAKKMGLKIGINESVLMTIIKETTNPVITSILAVAILAATVSTADSLISAISSNLSQDFSFFRKQKSISISKFLTGLISFLAIFFSFYFDNIVDMLMQSYELSISCLFVPIFISFFRKKGKTLSAFLAICFGAFGFILFRVIEAPFPKELLSIIFSGIGFFIGELVPEREKMVFRVEKG